LCLEQSERNGYIDDKKPNILMIVTDQRRYDCIGYANKYPVKTPNLDKLAREGMCFHHAYTNTPTCCPTRETLLNGRRCEAFGALWNFDITLKIPALEPTEYTWTKELKDNGYNLDYIGKWHVHPTCSPMDYGFDSYLF
jgi:arylsulfatase A-like enzyme